MIDGRRCGPYELDELVGADIRPDTYVWCKGMADWEQARDVADVCRQMRRHLAGLRSSDTTQVCDNPFIGPTSGGTLPSPSDISGEPDRNVPPGAHTGSGSPDRFSRYLGENRLPTLEEAEPTPDPGTKPPSLLIASIIVTLLCFPPTGLAAVYYSVMTARIWRESSRQSDAGNAESYRRMAWDYCRNTKMWIGITFFMGIMLWSFLIRFFL